MMMWGPYWGGAYGFGSMALGGLLWIGLIALGAYLIVRISRPSQVKGLDALAIAKERYAKGEINAEEFRSLKDELSK